MRHMFNTALEPETRVTAPTGYSQQLCGGD